MYYYTIHAIIICERIEFRIYVWNRLSAVSWPENCMVSIQIYKEQAVHTYINILVTEKGEY